MKESPMTAAAARRAAVLLWLASLVLTFLATGCSLPGQKLAACKAEKEQLLASIQEKQDRVMVLEAEKRQSDQRLAQAEKSLALLYDNRADIERIASRPDSSGGASTRPSTSLAPTSSSADSDTSAAKADTSGDADTWTQRPRTTRE